MKAVVVVRMRKRLGPVVSGVLSGMAKAVAGGLGGAIGLAVLAVSAGLTVLSAGPARAADPLPGPSVTFVTPAHVPYYVVPANNQVFLFQLAQQILGDGNEFNQIFDLNKGRVQPNGDKLTDPTAIEPGWYLVLPCKATGSDFGTAVQWNPPPNIVKPASVTENCAGIGPAATPVAVTVTPSGASSAAENASATASATSTQAQQGTTGKSAGSSGSSGSGPSKNGLLVGAGIIVLAVVGAVLWYRRGRRSGPAGGPAAARLPNPPVPATPSAAAQGRQAPRASAPPPAAPAAQVPAPPPAAPDGEFRPSAPRMAIGARLRRRKDPTAADLLLADPAVPALGARALSRAGYDQHWWPYAALVGADAVTVHLAGLEVPEPQSPWTVGEDARSWVLRRSVLEQSTDFVQNDESDASAESSALADSSSLAEGNGAVESSELVGAEVCPAVLGVHGDSVVVMDVARSHGTLLISGDVAQAERVRASLAEQLEGGRVLLGGAPQGPHWELPVDARGTVVLHGLAVTFAALPERVAETVPQPQVQPPQAQQPQTQQPQAQQLHDQAAPGAPGPESAPGGEEAPEDPDDWDDVAVSSA